MLQEQYDKLMQAAEGGACMSIAINSDGQPVQGGFVPWERTISGFNMKTPKITLSTLDLQNEAVMSALKQCELIGCYIFAPLMDHSFLREFEGMKDLFILHGEHVKDLAFVSKMPELFMFYLEDAELSDLKPLIDVCNLGKSLPGKCFGFYRCKIEDLSSLADIKFVLSELLIWPVEGDKRERWQTSQRPGVFRFYEN